MIAKLSEIATLQFGLYAKPSDTNDGAIYLQAKHLDETGIITESLDAKINIDNKSRSHLLQKGDVIFVGKGLRNFAWTYEPSIGPAIASTIFFVIKPDTQRVLPEYLTTIFNTTQSQAHFQTLGAGSSIPSIRKSELEAFPIKLPSLEVQHKIVQLQLLHAKEIELSKTIIQEKQRVFQAIINNLINKDNE